MKDNTIETDAKDSVDFAVKEDVEINAKGRVMFEGVEEEIEKEKIHFRDHHSLRAPSSSLSFRGTELQMFPQRNSEFVIERKGNEFLARIGKDGSLGLSFLRAMYTLASMFMAGLILVFCLQLLLFLFMGLTIDVGLTSRGDEIAFGNFLGAFLSVPLFVYSLASAMALATAFVSDAWNGHIFLNQTSKFKGVFTQFFAFAMFIGIPLIVAVIFLFRADDEWWAYATLTWFSCVFATFSIFSLSVIYYEIAATFELIRKSEMYPEVGYDTDIFTLAKYAVQQRQIQRYSGVKHIDLVTSGRKLVVRESMIGKAQDKNEYINLYSKFTNWGKLQDWGLVEDTADVRQYAINEVRDVAPFLTKHSWSLEKVFCRQKRSRVIVVTNGHNAVTDGQIRASFFCALIGNTLVFLFIAAFFTWFQVNAWVTIGVVILVAIAMRTTILETFKNFTKLKERMKRKEKVDRDEVVYQSWESYRFNKITPKVVWTLFWIEIGIFYIWPTVILFTMGNTPVAIFFMITGIISLFRHFFNASSVLLEVGNMGILDEVETKKLDPHSKDEEDIIEGDFYEKSRLDLIVGKISHGSRRDTWIYTFSVFVFIFCSLFVLAYVKGSSAGDGKIRPNLDPNDFVYEPESKLAYPTCRMGSEISIPGEEDTALIDYVYLSKMAYTDSNATDGNNSTQEQLDLWFGEGFAVDEKEVVDEYLKGVTSSVQFKLFSFPTAKKGFAILSIRGTNNGWDALSDAQLWSAAILAQAVRLILPFGEMWTPILENLVRAISVIESSRLREVAYYNDIKKFVHEIETNEAYEGKFSDLRITGHSLGGGLAMIAAAQTNHSAVALSGPNNLLSRKTFDPPITNEALNKYTFNIIPDKDVVPRIDDVAELYQRIHCRAPYSEFVNCHFAARSLCEVLFTCGNKGNTKNRPIFCYCHQELGYDKPFQNNTDAESFDEICKEPKK